jgi:phytoene synthase
MPAKPELSSIRSLAVLYSPDSERSVLEALVGIEAEIAESLRPGVDHHVAHTRLQWWREECERCAEGRAVHPLTRALLDAYGLPGGQLAGLTGFVDTAVWDLASATFETRREVTAYCERWAAAMVEPAAAHALAGSDLGESDQAGRRAEGAALVGPETAAPPRTEVPQWRGFGAALREIELLSNLAREAHLGRLRVPLDELDRAGVKPEELTQLPWPDSLVILLRERHETLRATVARSVAKLDGGAQSQTRGLLVWAALAQRLSLRAEKALPNAIVPKRYHSLAEGWHAWRAARKALAGKF